MGCVGRRIRFSQSARKHRVAAGRARAVLADPVAIVRVRRPGDSRDLLMHLGEDESGRALEVGVVEDERGDWLVIHVMDLRAKYREHYEHGKEESE